MDNRNRRDEVIELLSFTPYSQFEYERAREEMHTETDPIRKAVNEAVMAHERHGLSCLDGK